MRSGKIIAHHRHGQGKISAHALTSLRCGPIGDTGASRRMADTFVDCQPYVSLAGIDDRRTRDPRGNVMSSEDESHIHRRTRGKGSRDIVAPKREFGDG
jgi:hypothetical protein